MNIYMNYLLLVSTKNNVYFDKMEGELQKIIYKAINTVSFQKNIRISLWDKEELFQIILIKVYEKLISESFSVKKLDIFFNMIKNNEIESSEKDILDCYYNFIKIYENRKEFNLLANDINEEFMEQFTIYYGQTRLVTYIAVIAKSKVKDFFKSKSQSEISLNEKNNNGIEYINIILTPRNNKAFYIDDLKGISEEEKVFLKKFLGKNQLLT